MVDKTEEAVLKLLKINLGHTTLEVEQNYRTTYGYSLAESTIRKKLNFLEACGYAKHECQGKTWIWYLTIEGRREIRRQTIVRREASPERS